jgi:uncharacterized integral membrane protein (TIGR00697 family)
LTYNRRVSTRGTNTADRERSSTAAILTVSSYVGAQVLADIGSLKIISLAGVAVDAGTLIYPFTFTLRDLVHKVVGARGARAVILAAAGINLVMAGYFQLVARLPAAPEAGPQPNFEAVLAPVWRIVLASILAEVISQLTDTEIYRLWIERVSRRRQWARVLVSNSVSVPLDSFIFVVAAFGGTMPAAVLSEIILANIAIKAIVTLISMPMIYLVPEPAEEKESPQLAEC